MKKTLIGLTILLMASACNTNTRSHSHKADTSKGLILYYEKGLVADIATRVINKQNDTGYFVAKPDTLFKKDTLGRDTKVFIKDSTGKPKMQAKFIQIPNEIIVLDGDKRFPYK